MRLSQPPFFSLLRSGITYDLSGRPLFSMQSKFGQQVDVHFVDKTLYVPKYGEVTINGNVLFIDGEVQIGEQDFTMYHDAMLENILVGSNILVIGDGDGGFTQYDEDFQIYQVEPDPVVMTAASIFFNAQWQRRPSFNVDVRTVEEFIASDPTKSTAKYDAIILAITDDFNADAGNFAPVISLWEDYLKTGGMIIAQVGCIDDPDFHTYEANYKSLIAELATRGREPKTRWFYRFISCFLSDHMFMEIIKS